jgi:GNAT superfamily N-acetyltransferase
MTNRARLLAPHDLPDVITVMTDAFQQYPVMQFVAGPGGDAGARMRRLIELFVTRRQRRGGPMLGVFDPDTGTLVGAAVLTLPHEPDPPADLAPWVDAVWAELGAEALQRYQRYAETWPVIEASPHHHLNMIGIRRSHAGRGLARPLLMAVQQMAAEDPDSSGVSLTTEVVRNVSFYEHFGYRIVGHKAVAPDLESWGFFRATASA